MRSDMETHEPVLHAIKATEGEDPVESYLNLSEKTENYDGVLMYCMFPWCERLGWEGKGFERSFLLVGC